MFEPFFAICVIIISGSFLHRNRNPKSEIQTPKSNYAFWKNTRCHYIFAGRARFCGDFFVDKRVFDFCRHNHSIFVWRIDVRSRSGHNEQAIYALELVSIFVVSVSIRVQTSFALVARFDLWNAFESNLFYGHSDARFVSNCLCPRNLHRRRFAAFDGICRNVETDRRIYRHKYRRIRNAVCLCRTLARRGKPHFYRYGWLIHKNRTSYRIFITFYFLLFTFFTFPFALRINEMLGGGRHRKRCGFLRWRSNLLVEGALELKLPVRSACADFGRVCA